MGTNKEMYKFYNVFTFHGRVKQKILIAPLNFPECGVFYNSRTKGFFCPSQPLG